MFLSSKLDAYLSKPIRLLFTTYMGLTLGMGACFFYWSWRATQQEVNDALVYQGQILYQSTEATFQSFESLLIILGQRLVEQGVVEHPERGRALIEQTNQLHQGMAGFGLARSDGQLLLVSHLPAGTVLPNLLTGKETAQSFRQVLQSPGLHLGRSYFMAQLQKWVIPIRVSLTHPSNLNYVMTAGLTISGGDSPWNIQQLPQDVSLQVMRPDGYLQFQSPLPDTAPRTLQQAYGAPWDSQEFEQLAALNLDDRPRQDAYKQMVTLWNVPWQGQKQVLAVNYLPRFQVYIVVSKPLRAIYQEWWASSSVIMVGFITFILLSWFAFRALETLQAQNQSKIVYYATHDFLTGLPNRWLLCDRLEQMLLQAQVQHQMVGVFFLDLDHFKRINDSYGHELGDRLLKEVGQRLVNSLEPTLNNVSRQGGDEFIVVSRGVTSIAELEDLANSILKLFEQPFTLLGQSLNLYPSMGISVFPQDGHKAPDLLRNADTCLYRVKEQQRGSYLFFNSAMNVEVQRRLLLENELRQALYQHQIEIYYQPQVDLKEEKICGCEALMRWNHPTLGWVSPAEFIPIAEDIGLIISLGDFVLQQSYRDMQGLMHRLVQENKLNTPFHLAVNFSAKQLKQADILQVLENILKEGENDRPHLILEITESVL
ncbi:MAG: diguanylate cyclase domain-containing protein, partial [Prochlorotrichaceae cyanobacterium]